MKILVTGGGGQVAEALRRESEIEEDLSFVVCGRATLDITKPAAIDEIFELERPDIVVNAAAYTAVDGAEGAPGEADMVNGEAVAHLAQAASRIGARLIQISTDFVFDGSATMPIPPDAVPRPISAYGRSKLLGEDACERILGGDMLVLRTSWVYEPGGRNFVDTMLRLAETHEEIRVVADQFGAPTRARTVAKAIIKMVRSDERGIHHVTDAGVTTWFDFAVSVFQIATSSGILSAAPRVVPISTEEFKCAAARPRYSVLDTRSANQVTGVEFPYWRENLHSAISSWEPRSAR